jgi:pimeloyl-ACP methyl ester carboxylesterase
MTVDCHPDHVFRLADGRVLGYREFGDPSGHPVFLFHGIPGSRCGAGIIAEQASRRGVRLIGVDRPGIGLSTFQQQRTFLDWPADVAALADSLGFAQFGVVGNSGGSAYVAACAMLIPERLNFAGIISGMGPVDIPRWQDELKLPRTRRALVAVARRSPHLACRLAAPLFVREFDPAREGALERMKSMMAPADRQLLDQPHVAKAVLHDAAEAIRQGPLGVTWDIMLYSRPWGFRLQDVKALIHLWHGEADITVPPLFGRAMAAALPRCRATFWDGEGHLMAASRAEQIIDAFERSVEGSRSYSFPT